MILEVRHRTHYRYQSPAVFSQHLLHLTPGPTPGQRVAIAHVTITPEPESLDSHTDMFGNIVHVATVSRPHEELEILATARVDRAQPEGLIFDTAAPWEATCAAALGLEGQSPVAELGPFAFPSQMTEADPEIEAYARESFSKDRPVLAAAKELTHRIYTDFDYTPGATNADTLPTESFRTQRGVCQDFAHVMLAGLRALRIPARYISGYLRTHPPEGKQRLQGADASHAWVSVWDPAFGWVDFDPTNDCVPGQDHVTLAHGRDYSDVSPVSGVVVGAGAQRLSVGVDVTAAAET
ncbi:MAG: transglutaminase N-terminal domain-containing protein [Paracoccaceae bacterium]